LCDKSYARFPFKRNRFRCMRCVNENQKKRKCLRWQAANHGCHCFDRAFLLAGAYVCCVKFLRNKRNVSSGTLKSTNCSSTQLYIRSQRNALTCTPSTTKHNTQGLYKPIFTILWQWHMASTDKCQRGAVQTMNHIVEVESCPPTRFTDDAL